MSAMNDMIEQFNSIKAKMKADGERLVGEHIKELMASHQKIEAVKWTQYTPYFNDGEPCVFGVSEPGFKLVGAEAKEDDSDDDGWFSSWSTPPRGYKGAVDSFCKSFGAVPVEMMQAAFGDHVEVTVTRTEAGGVEVTVDEYEHD